ncbi:hypothetical protein MJG53_014180 [Ovis ammon polii x Ovis aries]|uniref:CCDC144C-like coiled-coil domain-containing protein n=2 Tax=Ovis TaxID=9935 RepID=A0A836CUW4_SHEEP|nr:hypothetical protein JEQ12_007039 [Ovis aries]KAI4568562.1 hypothetical protein MJG53_014180 [Ovis ammon polii x Ovis aries]
MEVESYRSRLAAASDNHDQSQTSKRDLEFAFQRARDEWLHLQDKMKTDVANLKDNKEMLSQQFSRVEIVRQLQQELADTLRKQSISEASLEVLSRYRANLEVEAQDLKKNFCQLTSQLQETQDQLTEAVRRAEKTQDHVQKYDLKQRRK